MSISLATRSVNLPFPSSPHWVPTTTVAGTRFSVRSVAGLRTSVPPPKWGSSRAAAGGGVGTGDRKVFDKVFCPLTTGYRPREGRRGLTSRPEVRPDRGRDVLLLAERKER